MNVDTVLSLCAAHLPEGYVARHNPNGTKIEVWPPTSVPEPPTLFLIEGSETSESLILTIVTVTWQNRLRVCQAEIDHAAGIVEQTRLRAVQVEARLTVEHTKVRELEADIAVIGQAYFECKLGSSPCSPDKVAAALRQASLWRAWGISWSVFPRPADQETRTRDDDGLRMAIAERIEKGVNDSDFEAAKATRDAYLAVLRKVGMPTGARVDAEGREAMDKWARGLLAEREQAAMYFAETSGGRYTPTDFTHRGLTFEAAANELREIRKAEREERSACDVTRLDTIQAFRQLAIGLILRGDPSQSRAHLGAKDSKSLIVMVEGLTAWPRVEETDGVHARRWAQACKVLGIPVDRDPPATLADFIDTRGAGELVRQRCIARLAVDGRPLSLGDALWRLTVGRPRADTAPTSDSKPGVQVYKVAASSATELAATAAALYSERREMLGAMGFEVRAYHKVFKAQMKLRFEPSAVEGPSPANESRPRVLVNPIHDAQKIADMFPAAKSIVVIDPDALADGNDPRMIFVSADNRPASKLQDEADVVVKILGNALQVLKNRQGEPGGPLTPGPMDPAIKRWIDRDIANLKRDEASKAPGWTGITWMSKKGRAKCLTLPRISGVREDLGSGAMRFEFGDPSGGSVATKARLDKLLSKPVVALHLFEGQKIIHVRLLRWEHTRFEGVGKWVLEAVSMEDAARLPGR